MARSFIATLVAAAACCNLAGCSTLMNPYVDPPTRTQVTASTSQVTASTNKWSPASPYGDATTLPDARDYAAAYAETYRRAAADHAKARNWLGVGSILATTTGLIKGAVSPLDGSDLLPILSYSTTGALNMGGLLISSPRQAVYLEGQIAMLCARSRSAAYLISPEARSVLSPGTVQPDGSVKDPGLSSRYTRLANRLTEAETAKAAITAKVAAAAQQNFAPGSTGDLEANELRARQDWLTQQIAEGRRVLELAEPIKKDLDAYEVRLSDAAQNLFDEVTLIAAATDKLVQRTEPDLEDIRNAVSKSSMAPTFELPSAAKPKAPGAESGGDAAPPPRTLLDFDIKLQNEIDSFKSYLPFATAVRDQLLLKEAKSRATSQCLVAGLVMLDDIPAPATALVAGEGELIIPIQLIAHADVVKAKMLSPPSWQINGQPAGLTGELIVVDNDAGVYKIRIKAAASVTPATYTLVISAPHDVKPVKFKVAAKPAAKKPDTPDAAEKPKPETATPKPAKQDGKKEEESLDPAGATPVVGGA